MIKKILLLIAIFFVSTTSSYAGYDGRIMAITSLYTKLGYIKSPQLIESIAGMRSFSYFDSSGNEINKFIIEGRSQITKFDDKGSSVEGIFRYGENYISQYNYPNYYKDDEVALYRLSNNTIYEYDNKPDKKKGILGALGFYEDGPGNLVSYYKISPNGLISQFDNLDNLVSTLKITDNKTFSQYDTNGKKIAFYKILNNDETFPKKESTPVTKTTTTTNNTEIGIVPSIALFGQAQKIKDFSWAQNFDNTSSISYYDGYGEYAGHFNITSNSASYYNNYGNYAGGFRLSGNDVNYYDAKGNYTGRFKLSGDDINIYNAYDNYVGRLKFYNSDITYYNSQGNQIGRFKFYSSDITYYNNNGEQVGRFKF